jgi:peptidoglycan hydrolase-like protein with peptidoglycan-binding domain
LHLHADGVFGPHTKRAVARFQRHHHLRGTGVVTAGTWKALHL